MKIDSKAHNQIIQNLQGTMAIEGITVSNSTMNNIMRIVNGTATYDTIIQELNKKYLRAKT